MSKKERILPALVALLFLASIFGVTFDSISATSNPFSIVRLSASTYVSGRITTNTTWTLSESPYVIEGDVVVETDVFLTIEPGVVVKFTKFNNGTNLIIDGAIIANGNFTHPIIFTSNATTPQPGDWGTIRFRDTSIDEACIIDWATIEYASAGITLYKSSPKISNSIMQYNVDGFYSESEGIARIYNSKILNNTNGVGGNFRGYYYPPYNRSEIFHSLISNNTYGVLLRGGDLTIQETTISNNTYGVRSSGYGYLMIQESDISNNTYGIWSPAGTLRILGSNISYNNHGINARSATISKSIISQNNGKGISPTWWYNYYYNRTDYDSGAFSISYSTIIGNKENGVISKGTTIVHFSNIYGNGPYDVYNIAPFEWGYADVNATSNWWGTTNTTEIDQHIYDYYDDYDLRTVYYHPFLDSPITIPPIAHDVAITNVTASPTSVSAGGSVYITVGVVNEGDFDENVTVIARYDSVQIGNWTYMYGLLRAGASATASFYWYTWGVPSGNYTISAEVNVVPGETDTADNVFVDGIVEVIGPPPEPPYASFTYSPYYPSVGETVTFDASYSYDPDGSIVSYVWNFGDTTAGTGMIVTHVYNASGTYNVTLTVTDNDGLNATSSQSVTVSPPGVHDIAIIDVFVYPTEVPPGEVVLIEVTVANEGNFSETFDVTAYYRDFNVSTVIGMRTFSLMQGATTMHVFEWDTMEVSEGTYTIVAEATVVEGETDTADNTYVDGTVTILPELVVHDIAVSYVEVSATHIYVGETVYIYFEIKNEGSESETFDVYVYADMNTTVIGDEIIIAIFADVFLDRWAGLGASWDTTGVEPDHYTISVEVPPVPDEVDTSDNIFVNGIVTITLPPPIASFSWEPETPYVGDSVVFDASASYDPDGTIVGYHWDFGDETTVNTTEPIIEHTYDQTNTYTVTLTVTDDDGLTNTATAHITVIHRVLSVELSGEFDYLEREHVRIKIAALVRDAVTMEPVSDANVSIQIYNDKNKLWVSSFMKETPSGTGIYIWTSRGTILSERIKKGVYLVRIGASSREGPTAYNMMLFHIDPPAEGANQTLYYYATLVTVIALTSAGITLIKRRIANKIRRLNR